MKRLLSLILALCMMISLLPSISFAADTHDAWYFGVYHTYTSNDKTNEARYTFDYFTATDKSLPWAYVSSKFVGTNNWSSDGASGKTPGSSFYRSRFAVDTSKELRFAPKESNSNYEYKAITFELDAATSGTFVPEITLGTAVNAPQYDVYFTEKTKFEALGADYSSRIEALADTDDLLFTVDGYDATGTTTDKPSGKVSASGKKTVIDANKNYYVTLIANEAGKERQFDYYEVEKTTITYNCLALYIYSFELVPPEKPKLSSVELSYDETAKKITINGGMLTDNSAADLTGMTVSYGIDGTNEVSVNASTGDVYVGTKDETITLWADVTLDGTTVRGELKNITVKGEALKIYNYKISTNSLTSTALSDYGVSSFSNNDLAFVSWKSKKSDVNPALDMSLTDGFELVGRTTNDNAPKLYASGFSTQFRMSNYDVAADTETKYYEKNGTDGRSHFAVRLNVPRAGEYKISAVNNFAVDDSAIKGTINAYENNAESLDTSLNDVSEMDTGMVTQVYFGEACEDYTKKGIGSIITNGTKLSMYDSREFGKKTELGTVTVDAPGEYYLLFDTNSETFARNPVAYKRFTYSNNVLTVRQTWQIFCLSEIRLTPTNMPVLSEIELEFEDNVVSVESAKMSDNTYLSDLKSATVIYGIDAEQATVNASTGKVTVGDIDETVTLWADVTVNDVTKRGTITVDLKTVPYSEYSLTYDFRKSGYLAETPIAKISMEDTGGFWSYHSAEAASNQQKVANYGLYARTNSVGHWIAFKLYVPAAGKYDAVLSHFSGPSGDTDGEAYIIPGDARNIGTAIKDASVAQSLGKVNYYAEAASYDVETVPVKVVFDKPGEYLLVLKSGAKIYMYPSALNLIGSSDARALQSISANDLELRAGETGKINVESAYLSGYDYSNVASDTNYSALVRLVAEGYTVSYESEDSSVAEVNTAGKVTAVSEGETRIVVTAELNGTSVRAYSDITVLMDGASGYTVNYDFTTADAENASYEDTYNFWAVNGDEIEINVPVAGKYRVSTNGWNGTVRIDGNDVEEVYSFPDEGKYSVEFVPDGDSDIPEKLTLNGGAHTAPMGAELTFNGYFAAVEYLVLSDGSTVSTDGAKISYSIDDFSVAAIDEVNGKILPGRDGGKTVIRAKATYDGFTVEGEIDAEIEGYKAKASGAVAIYNFNTASDAWKNANYTGWDDKYGGATTWNIKGITYADTDGWAWHMSSDDSLKPTASMWTGSGGATIQPGANGWAAIKLKIPAAGRYWVTLTSSKSYDANYGTADVYFVPITSDKAELEASLTDDNKLVTLNCNDSSLTAAKAVTDELGAVNFKSAGDYLMVYRDKGGNKRVIPRILTLSGQNGVRYANFTLGAYDLEVGDKLTADTSARLLDGTELTKNQATFIYASSNEEVATFIDGEVEAVGDGEATLTFTAIYGSQTVSLTRNIKVTNTSELLGVELVPAKTSDYAGKGIELSARLNYEKGLPRRLNNTDVTYSVVEGSAGITGGVVTSSVAGKVKVTATYNGMTSELAELEFKPGFSKSGSTYYTEERVAAARKNIKKYSWAKSEYEGTIKTADNYLPYIDKLFGAIAGRGLPKSYKVGYRDDPDYVYCRYCGANAEEVWGGFTYSLERMWKIQCPACKRLFPSNDFELLYSRGLVNGNYDVETARKNNAIAVANGEKDALVNELYPELYNPQSESCNIDPRTGDAIDGKLWGVDDGWGYHTGRTYDNGEEEVHTYVSYFAYKIPNIVAYRAQDFGEAYIYTGDAKYGRAGAILLDRIADVYPDAFTNEFFSLGFATGGGGDDRGKFTGRISDAERADVYALAADALYPYLQTEDPELIKYLSAKEEELNYENKKTSAQDVWNNWKDNLLWESFEAIKTCHLLGNTGYHQSAAAGIMLVLDEEPRSSEILDWLYTGAPTYGSGVMEYDSNPGGNVAHNFLELIDRDGMGNEASPSYNLTWVFHFNDLAKYIRLYTNDPQYDLYQNPKFMQMYRAAVPVVLTKTHHAQIGDSGSTATLEFLGNYESVKSGFYYMKDTPVGSDIAEYIYMRNGDSVNGLHYDIFTEDPESMQTDIEALINGSTARESEMMPGYGFAVLRDGDEHGDKSLPTYTNNMRDFWMWFGVNGNWSHAHQDALNIGIESYGLNMAPDLGYSESSGQLPSRWQWVRATISHNTVVVNEKNQVYHGGRSTFPKHFDDSGDVKVMDIDASGAYNETSIYRRTLVMINAGPDVSYGVDFFRIKGGTDHVYSFHSQSDTIYETEGLGEIHYQTDNGKADGSFIGTYAGENVKYGPDPSNSTSESRFQYKSGYTWMKDVRRAYDVNKFSIDYNVTDFRKALKDGKGLHMRLTMLNDFELSEVAMTKGHVSPKAENLDLPEQLEYMLARRTSENGESLDSLYTTVYEPYKGERYLASMDAVQITTDEEVGADDTAKAVKVVRKADDGSDGRVDYIVYATNNDVTYTVTDEALSFNFRGFVGVYSVNENGVCIYSYVHDGDIIGENVSDTKQYTGRISKFTDTLTTDNFIWIEPDGSVDPSDIVGKYMFIDNDAVDNGVYKIESAEADGELLKLGIGMSSVLRSYKDDVDTSLGYVYNIGKGQKVTVPISNTENLNPVITEVADATVSAGSSFSTTISSQVESGSAKYIGTTLPRGASINADTGVVTWKPDASQVGNNHFAVTVRDADGRESTVNFIVTVYGSTTSKPSADDEKNSSASGGGGGGGTVGGGTVDTNPNGSTSENTGIFDETDNDDASTQPDVGFGGSDEPKFTDLENHAWAADAINSLAADGIVKGTTATTFSPANNITRADFALLLVRAFNLSSDSAENFTDVSASDYFASELAIARNTGIVNGIGDNKYAPRNTITRQDMMVIVYRAIKPSLPKGGGTAEWRWEDSADESGEILSSQSASLTPLPEGELSEVAEYPDFDTVADYARDAVSALISSGIVNGKSGRIAPTDYTTRAEVAVLLKRILEYKASLA